MEIVWFTGMVGAALLVGIACWQLFAHATGIKRMN